MCQRVLIAQTGFLGDVVLSTSLMQAARELWPRAYVAALVRPAAVPLLQGLPFLDEVLPDERGSAASRFRTLARLRQGRFDLGLSTSRSPRVGMLLRLAGVRRRAGYRLGANRCFYTDLVDRPDGEHVSRRDLSLLQPLGVEADWRRPQVAVATALGPALEAALRECPRPWVALAPGSVWPTKRWTVDGFAGVARSLAAGGATVLLVGSPDERAVAAEVAQAAPEARNFCGHTTLPELAALLAQCDALVCNDSAPAHIAGAVGTPVVQLYGPTTPDLGFAPLDPRSRTVEVELDCRPCAQLHAPACPRGHFRCMREITPEQVLGAVRATLAPP